MLNHLLEACPRAADVVAELAARLPSRALLVVAYSNTASLPGRFLRRHWRRFFHWKAVYFNSENLRSMLERAGLRFVAQSGMNTSYTVSRALDLVLPGTQAADRRAARGPRRRDRARADRDLRVDLRARRRVEGRRAVVGRRARVQRGGLCACACSTSCWPSSS